MKNKTTYQKKRLNEWRSDFNRLLLFGMLMCLLFTSAKTAWAQIDPLEYPPGHPGNITVSPIQQLQSFPVPRYKPGHTLLPNFNEMDPIYFGGYMQPGATDAGVIKKQADIQRELATNFNYMINVTWFQGAYNDTCVAIANAHPEWKVATATLRAQTGTKIWDQNLSNSHYAQNAAGQFLDNYGNVTNVKQWRCTAPVQDYQSDGDYVRSLFDVTLANLTRNVDLISEDGEIYPYPNQSAMRADPLVNAAINADPDYSPNTGIFTEGLFLAKMIQKNDSAYKSRFMSHPRLQNAIYAEYNLDGNKSFSYNWDKIRYVQTPINGHYYPTTEFYPRWPWNWKDWQSAWHGLRWVSEARYYEIAVGDKLFSPYVAAGWDNNEENNMRPAQFLGLTKILGVWGTDFFYSCFFNEGPYDAGHSPAKPEGYTWQAAIPPYAQALSTRYEDLLKGGHLMNGDVIDYQNPIGNIPKYEFNTGAANKKVSARKSDTGNKYVISGTIQNSDNVAGSTPLTSTASFAFDGQQMNINIRRQGSTYIYDNTVPSAPVFYQLDAWHESSHPWYWSKDFNLEAELYDNTSVSYNLKTTVPAGTTSGDYRSYSTFITFPDAQTSFTPIEYNFTPRVAPTTYYLWVKMRSRVNGATTGLSASVDNGNSKTISCAADTIWKWYRIEATSQQAISYSNLTLATHTLRVTPANSKLEIDQIVLSTNSNLGLTPAGPTCTTNCTATATPNGATTFCQGGSVVLTASGGTSYLWTPGNQTTQSITVNASGTYSVSVGQSNGCSATSSAIAVNVSSVATPTISANGAVTFCQGSSVTLTASSGSSYLWTPGNQTTQSITVSTSGSYSVRVTNAAGCSASSSVQNVTVNVPAVPVITPNGSTNIIQGQTVTLTSSSGASYSWLPNGQTTQSIAVGTAGTYRVNVTYANGCSATSSAMSVTVTTPVTIAVTGSSTICSGDSVMLTASSGFSYLWLPGMQTTSTIYVKTSGTYTVQASNGTSAQSIITVNDKPMVPSITTTYIPNSAYQLTAYEPSAVSYLWSNGQTAQTITMTAAGTVTVNATNMYGCVSSAQSMAVVSPVAAPCGKANMLTSYGIVDISAMLAWNPAIIADSFVVSYAPVGTNNYQHVKVAGNVSSAKVSGLTPGTGYQWLVKTYCTGGNQSSNTTTFTTLSGPLSCGSTPINLTTRNITQNTATLYWYASSAQEYVVQYRKAGTGAFINQTVPVANHPDRAYLSNLLANTTYEWKVKSVCNGTSTLYSPVAIFNTTDTCTPSGVIHLVDVTHNMAIIGWDNSVAADTFKIIYTVQGTTDYKLETIIGNPPGGLGQINNLLPDTYYTVKVRTKCASGGKSSWSNVLVIHTHPAPVARIDTSDPWHLNVYPNPVQDILNYAFISEKSADYNIKIADMSGRELFITTRKAIQGLNGNELNVNGFAKGIYMLTVEQGPSVSRFKFSKQ
ncbi:MAG: fibronectin type III domain-containing protein [Bacteroidia bacterium]